MAEQKSNKRIEELSTFYMRRIIKKMNKQSASQEARERAIKLGFDLAEDETYVQPFVRNVLRLREREEEDG